MMDKSRKADEPVLQWATGATSATGVTRVTEAGVLGNKRSFWGATGFHACKLYGMHPLHSNP